MIALPAAVEVPLHKDEFGTIRVGDTRVSLESVIADFHRGAKPEEIVEHFSVLNVTDIYHIIGYYLANKHEIDAYIDQQNKETERIRQEWETQNPSSLTREILMARLKANSSPNDPL